MALDEALCETLTEVARAMAPARRKWWVVASAAVALHGADAGTVRDVDVLFDHRDCETILPPLGLEPQAGLPDGRFRSDIFVSWPGARLTVELFAGFHLFEDGRWRELRPATRLGIALGDAQVFIPERAELKAMLMRFGRPKDMERAALL